MVRVLGLNHYFCSQLCSFEARNSHCAHPNRLIPWPACAIFPASISLQKSSLKLAKTCKNQPNILGGKSLFWGASFQIVEDWRPDSPNGVGTSVLDVATKFCPGKRNRTYDRSHQRREWRLCCNCVLVYPGSCEIYSHPNQASWFFRRSSLFWWQRTCQV